MTGSSCWETSKQGRLTACQGKSTPVIGWGRRALSQLGGGRTAGHPGDTLEHLFLTLCPVVRKWTAAANVSWKRQGWLGAQSFQWWGFESFYQLNSILKSRDITLPTKVHLVKTMVFPVVMDGCESWIIKKAECQRINLLNCCVEEVSWESLGLQGDQTSLS